MLQLLLYFRYWFQTSTENYFLLSIPYVSCHSNFNGNCSVYSVSVFTNDFWVRSDAVFAKVPFVNDDSEFRYWFMCQWWISFRCRFHMSPVTQFSMMICGLVVMLFSVTIQYVNDHFVFRFWFPYVSRHSIFNDDFLDYSDLNFVDDFWFSSDDVFTNDSMRQWWLCFPYWFHASTVN